MLLNVSWFSIWVTKILAQQFLTWFPCLKLHVCVKMTHYLRFVNISIHLCWFVATWYIKTIDVVSSKTDRHDITEIPLITMTIALLIRPSLTLHVIKLKSSLQKFYGRHHYLVNRHGYLSHKWPLICSTCRNHNLVLYVLIHDLSPGL